ncbi:hypothetical protein CDD83_9876 [Cordyceps sp. RAO-2017]|nr:hypothetical protein CDD83_9876 [Cordyceps sp. RAO-2017]
MRSGSRERLARRHAEPSARENRFVGRHGPRTKDRGLDPETLFPAAVEAPTLTTTARGESGEVCRAGDATPAAKSLAHVLSPARRREPRLTRRRRMTQHGPTLPDRPARLLRFPGPLPPAAAPKTVVVNLPPSVPLCLILEGSPHSGHSLYFCTLLTLLTLLALLTLLIFVTPLTPFFLRLSLFFTPQSSYSPYSGLSPYSLRSSALLVLHSLHSPHSPRPSSSLDHLGPATCPALARDATAPAPRRRPHTRNKHRFFVFFFLPTRPGHPSLPRRGLRSTRLYDTSPPPALPGRAVGPPPAVRVERPASLPFLLPTSTVADRDPSRLFSLCGFLLYWHRQ